ncbi:MAG: hypothetical protein GIW95_03045 [Candidatus Eremiobacteraeota bacterium]|nr:hypothetical protein [Candidatus Eremiobacteraeota bacterium]
MKRSLAVLAVTLFAVSLGYARPAVAADAVYTLTIDGRPLTPPGKPTGALSHGGVVYVDVVQITKAFSGLLTFGSGGSTVTVSVGHKTATFIAGKTTADFGGTTKALSGKPFVIDGDLFVPLSAVAALTNSKFSISPAAHTAALKTSQS